MQQRVAGELQGVGHLGQGQGVQDQREQADASEAQPETVGSALLGVGLAAPGRDQTQGGEDRQQAHAVEHPAPCLAAGAEHALARVDQGEPSQPEEGDEGHCHLLALSARVESNRKPKDTEA